MAERLSSLRFSPEFWDEACPRLDRVATAAGEAWVAWARLPEHHDSGNGPGPLDRAKEGLLPLLAEPERVRTQAMSKRRQHEFIVARALARTLAGAALVCAPASVPIALYPSGKPHIVHNERTQPLWFSLAHARGLVVVALSSASAVGIDAESTVRRPRTDLHTLAERVFGPGDRAALAACPAEQRAELFLRLWVRREAVVKAAGTGLAATFGAFDVCELARPIAVAGSPARYEVADLGATPGYLVALACAH